MGGVETISISDYADVLRRRRGVVITFFAVTVVIVAIVTFSMTPVYRATTKLLIDIESPNVLATTVGVEIGARDSSSYYSYRGYFTSQIEIMTSRSIAQQVVEEFDLADSREYASEGDVAGAFMEKVKVEPIADTRIVELKVESTDPELAARMANRMAEIYIRRNLAYISKSERLNLLKNEYLRLEKKMSESSKVYKHGHPEMIKLKQEMAEMREYMDKEKTPGPIRGEAGGGEMQDQYHHALASLKANNVSVIDLARVPTTPVKPKKMLNLLMAVFMGLFGGAGLALFFEYQDVTVKDPEDVEKLTKWPFLGKVPRIPGTKKEFYVQHKVHGHITEAYRAIGTRIFFSDTQEHPLKSIVISSLGPQEGKTTSICNLGIVMAQNRKRVLLVDADMHKPRLNRVFRAEKGDGLSSFLTGQAGYKDVVQGTGIENVFLVADDRPSQNPSVLLASEKMKEFMDIAVKDFDFVFFDTPPIGALTDATILSKMADGIALVVESGKTPKKALLRNHTFLTHSDIRCAGVIIVKAPISGRETYYYHHV